MTRKPIVSLWLTDSRARSATGRRNLYIFPPTAAGHTEAWDVVLKAEVAPAERKEYRGLTRGTPEPEVFNDYWAEYGWNLTFVEDATLPADCNVIASR